MVYAIDPNQPFVWRDPHTVQIGLDDSSVIVPDVDGPTELFLWSLRKRVADQALPHVAELAGVSATRCQELIKALKPVLIPRLAPAPPVGTIAIDSIHPMGERIAALLEHHGYSTLSVTDDVKIDSAPIVLALIVGAFVIEPHRHIWWLRRDIPHLAITIHSASIEVGPLVDPGFGPCLYCVDRHRADNDPAWPVLAPQVATVSAPRHSPMTVHDAVALASRAAVNRLSTNDHSFRSQTVHISAESGRRTEHSLTPHAHCLCGSLEETVTALAAVTSRSSVHSSSPAGAGRG